MSKVTSTIAIRLKEGLTLAHHCQHQADSFGGSGYHSWRIEGLQEHTLYFTGTTDELLAFAEELRRVANDTTARRLRRRRRS